MATVIGTKGKTAHLAYLMYSSMSSCAPTRSPSMTESCESTASVTMELSSTAEMKWSSTNTISLHWFFDGT